MKVLIAIPVMGSFEIGRISLYQWDRTASPDASFLLIDNSPQPSPYSALFEREFLDQKRWIYHPNAENVGLIRSAQQAYNFALGMGADILVLTHNDVWVYPNHKPYQWDEYLAGEFRSGKNFGVIGLFGSKGCSSSGHRLDTFGSLIEMAGHGRRMTEWIEPAVCLDGFFLACSMAMLKAAVYQCEGCNGDGQIERASLFAGPGGLRGGISLTPTDEWEVCPLCKGKKVQTGGFDQRYAMHHVYDYDISLTSIELGYRNAVVNIPCHHLSGLTANNAAYATSGQDVHQANYDKWLAKWSAKLGLTVDSNWNYTWGAK